MNWQAVIDNLKLSSKMHLENMSEVVATNQPEAATCCGAAALVLASLADALTAGLKDPDAHTS